MFWLNTPYSELNMSNCRSVKAGEDLNAGDVVLVEKDTNSEVLIARKPTSDAEAAKVTGIVGVVQNNLTTVDPNGFITGYKSGVKIQVINGVEFTLDAQSFVAGTYTKGTYTGLTSGGKVTTSGAAVSATAAFFRVEDYKALSPSGALLTLSMKNLF